MDNTKLASEIVVGDVIMTRHGWTTVQTTKKLGANDSSVQFNGRYLFEADFPVQVDKPRHV